MSHVCSHWRATALATPLLWRNIDVYSPKSLHCVSRYLERSKNCPIHIRIIWWPIGGLDLKDGATEIIPVIDLLYQHATRWQTFLVSTSYSIITNPILFCMKDLLAPLLEQLHIQVNDDKTNASSLDPVFPLTPSILIGGAPRLVTLSTNEPRQLPPFKSITTVHLDVSRFQHNGSDVLSSLVFACPSLSTLSIHGTVSGDWTVVNATMPSIRSLWFSNNDKFAGKFLTTVELPKLGSLGLDCGRAHYQVASMLYYHRPGPPSFPLLKHLTLQSFDYFASEKYAKVFPTISTLHSKFGNSFHLVFLKQVLEDLENWKNLETLVFEMPYENQVFNYLNNIVVQRGLGDRPIQRILLNRELLVALPAENTISTHTSLDELRADNYDDPWWIISNAAYNMYLPLA
ncbi:hypothetical protein H0H92_008641 [Tricholoma furcatifolium]|nr:hypothetical protein H0H92_008641 [Tricholoma furcatifolium]